MLAMCGIELTDLCHVNVSRYMSAGCDWRFDDSLAGGNEGRNHGSNG